MAEQIEGHWSELGWPKEPCEYLFRGRYKVRVRRQEIELANERGKPDARFTASREGYLSEDEPFTVHRQAMAPTALERS
jgi:hypothetical protein